MKYLALDAAFLVKTNKQTKTKHNTTWSIPIIKKYLIIAVQRNMVSVWRFFNASAGETPPTSHMLLKRKGKHLIQREAGVW